MNQSESRCARCKAVLAPNAKFCRECGSAVEATTVEPEAEPQPTERGASTCPACSAPIAAGAAFCRSCGERLEAPAAAAQTSPSPAAPAPAPATPPAMPPPPPQEVAERGRSGGRGPLVAIGAVLGCLLLGGLAAGGAYLLISGGSDEGDSVSATDVELIEPSPSASEEAEASEGAGEGAVAEAEEGKPTPTERGFPTDSMSVMREDAEALLREFHVAVVERDFRYAWSLLTARKRRKEAAEKTYAGWKGAQASLTPYLLPEGIEVRIDGLEEEGVARVQVTGMGWTEPGSPCTEWSGLTWVRYEGGAWRYDPGYSTTEGRRRRWEGRSGELLGVGC